ncbi:MAG: GyrI-like domain-containing protein [Defluviitaleaceae bacterium]|nr:GyrI-like domain-containing protein [Defluviitaleaceae bacterium]
MNPKFVNFGPMKIAGYLHKTSMSNNTIPAFWQELFADGRHSKLHQQDWLKDHKEYGLCFDSVGDEFSYVVGVEVKNDADVSNEFHVCDLPKSEYAVFPAKSINDIPLTWKEAYEWLQSAESHFFAKGGIEFELYDLDCTCVGGIECENCKNDNVGCDIYVAVTKK